jgi:hypothetical protein
MKRSRDDDAEPAPGPGSPAAEKRPRQADERDRGAGSAAAREAAAPKEPGRPLLKLERRSDSIFRRESKPMGAPASEEPRKCPRPSHSVFRTTPPRLSGF